MMPTLHRPETLAEACSILSTVDNAMVYGGGTAIQILRKQGVLFADHFVDLSRILGLDQIRETPDGITAGPMVTVRRMETDERVRRIAPLAAAAYRHVANPRVRNTASIGGNLAHGDYRLDPPPALLVLGGSVEATSVRGTRPVPVREFFTDFQQTALAADELVSAVRIAAQPERSGYCFLKNSSLSANDWPCASAAVLVTGPVKAREVRIGIGALAPIPRLVTFDASGLSDQEAVEAALEGIEPVLDPIPDIRGGVEYKRRLARVTVEDAVRNAWKDIADD